MLYGVLMVVHILVAFFLIIVVLLQGGRGGMAEAMGGVAAQSLFGGSANMVMTKLTAVVAAVFMGTCLSLAVLSTSRGRSVTDQIPMNLNGLPGLPSPSAPVGEPALPPVAPVAPTPAVVPAPAAPSSPAPAASAPAANPTQ